MKTIKGPAIFLAQFAGQQLESDEHRRRPAAVEQFDDARDQVVGGSSARHRGFSTPVRRLDEAAASRRPTIRQPLD